MHTALVVVVQVCKKDGGVHTVPNVHAAGAVTPPRQYLVEGHDEQTPFTVAEGAGLR